MSEADTRRFNEIYTEQKKEYVKLLDRLSKNSIYWWATPLSSRNWYLSGAFKEICISFLGIERIRQDCEIQKVFCPSQEIADTIGKYCRQNGREIAFDVKRSTEEAGVREILFLFGQLVAGELEKYRKITEVLRGEPSNRRWAGEKITLIDTYIKASEVKKTEYEEQYFKNILDYVEGNIFFLSKIILNTRTPIEMLVKQIRKNSKYRYLFQEQFLKISDYCKLLYYPLFCLGFCLNKKYMCHVDVTAIINRDLRQGIASNNAVDGLLKYFAVRRMKRRGLEIGKLIGWYEGQPSSNGLFFGYRTAYPAGKSTGYIGYALDRNNINIAPGKVQARHKAAPQKMAVIARCFQQIPRQFVTDTEVSIVPALRLQKVNEYRARSSGDQKKVLIALSYEKKTSAAMLRWIKEAECFFRENNIKLHLKNHPCNTEMRLKNYGIAELNCPYIFVSGAFGEAVSEADLVITTQSNAGYETALYGKPIVFMNFPSQLNMNYMPHEWEGERFEVVYDTGELETAVKKFLGKSLAAIDLHSEMFHVAATRETVSRLFDEKI